MPAVRARHIATKGGLAEMIVARRGHLGLSLREVGVAAGVDPSLVWQLEVGRTINPKIRVINGLSIALKVPFERVCRAALVDAQAKRERA